MKNLSKQMQQNKNYKIMKNKKVIIRSKSAGVFFGTLISKKSSEVTLHDCRRIYYWSGAATLSQLSQEGVKNPSDCKFTMSVPQITILETIEIIPCTDVAISNIESVPVWKI